MCLAICGHFRLSFVRKIGRAAILPSLQDIVVPRVHCLVMRFVDVFVLKCRNKSCYHLVVRLLIADILNKWLQ